MSTNINSESVIGHYCRCCPVLNRNASILCFRVLFKSSFWPLSSQRHTPTFWLELLLSYLHALTGSFCLFILFMGFSRQECWSDLPFPSPVDHVLSALSTMTCLSWVALHSMAHSFIELDKAVVHVIRLVSFLWLWLSFRLPSDG